MFQFVIWLSKYSHCKDYTLRIPHCTMNQYWTIINNNIYNSSLRLILFPWTPFQFPKNHIPYQLLCDKAVLGIVEILVFSNFYFRAHWPCISLYAIIFEKCMPGAYISSLLDNSMSTFSFVWDSCQHKDKSIRRPSCNF